MENLSKIRLLVKLGIMLSPVNGQILLNEIDSFQRKIDYYEGKDRETLYEEIVRTSGKEPPKHKFTDEGTCIRCGIDLEEWEAGCVEELIEELGQTIAQLRSEKDGRVPEPVQKTV